MVRYVTCSGKAITAGGLFLAYQSKNLEHSIGTNEVWPIFVFDPWNQKRTQKHVFELAAAETAWKSLQ
jgi:hypothetical protein